jgi:tetratricopeptide (TPR) repeat protein
MTFGIARQRVRRITQAACVLILACVNAALGQAQSPSHALAEAESLFAAAKANWGDGTSVTVEQALRQALALRQSALAGNDPRVAEVQDSLGKIFYNRGLRGAPGSLERGEHLFSTALAAARQTLGPNDLTLADYFGDEGAGLRELGRYDQAISMVCQSLAIRRSVLGPHSAKVAASLHNLALIASYQGNMADQAWLEAGSQLILAQLAYDTVDSGDPASRALRKFCPAAVS